MGDLLIVLERFCLNLEGFKLITLILHTIYLILELYTLISIIILTRTNVKAHSKKLSNDAAKVDAVMRVIMVKLS